MNCNSTIALFEEEVRKFQEAKNANVKKALDNYNKHVNWWIQFIVKYCAKMKVHNIHSDRVHIPDKKVRLLKSMHTKILTEVNENLPGFTVSIDDFYIRIVQNDVQPRR